MARYLKDPITSDQLDLILAPLKERIQRARQWEMNTKVGMKEISEPKDDIEKWEPNDTFTVTIEINGGATDQDRFGQTRNSALTGELRSSPGIDWRRWRAVLDDRTCENCSWVHFAWGEVSPAEKCENPDGCRCILPPREEIRRL